MVAEEWAESTSAGDDDAGDVGLGADDVDVDDIEGDDVEGGVADYPLRYSRPSPTEYPRIAGDIPPIGGRIRVQIEDFEVEEIPLYLFSGRGEHCYVTVVKTNRTTLEAREYLAQALGVRSRDIGFAGFKDRRAVAKQTFSIAGVRARDAAAIDTPWLRTVSVTYHTNKLRTGHLLGNRFRIRIRDVQPGAADHARAALARVREIGLANFYGPQRFGFHCDSFLVGNALLRRNPHAVVELLLAPRPGSTEPHRDLFARQRYAEALEALPRGRPVEAAMLHMFRRYPGNERAAVRRIPHEMKRMYFSAYQGFLFNWCLKERLAWGADSIAFPQPGDLAWMHDRGRFFPVTDPVEARARAERGEISPTGPIFGRKAELAQGEEGRLERTVLAAEHLRLRSWLSHTRGLHLDGARRPYRIPIGDVELKEEEEGRALLLSFVLPPGSYATTLLEEIMGPGRTRAPEPEDLGEELDVEGREAAS